jgi:hypothetical protein
VSKKEAIIYVLGAIIVLIASIVIIALNKPHIKIEDRSSIPVSAAELGAAYLKDEAMANAHYLNKPLEVSGSISGIDHNQDGGSMVLLGTGSPDAMVQCTMRDAAAALPRGTSVKLKGFCTGSNLSGVTLTDCIVSNN